MGMQDYCQELFQGSFTFWGDNDLKDKCQAVIQKQGEDKCAALNEHIFQSYKETQQNVLNQVIEKSKFAIANKKAKDQKLQQFLEQDDSVHLTTTQNLVQSSQEKEELNSQVCQFLSEFGDIDAELKKACDS